MHRSVRPRSQSPGRPGSWLSRSSPRPSFELPRLSRPINATGAETSGRPAASLFQLRLPVPLRVAPHACTFGYCRRWSFELPRLSHPFSASGGFQAPGRPGPYFARCAYWCLSPGRPGFQHLPTSPAIRASSCPDSRLLQRLWRVHHGYAPQLRSSEWRLLVNSSGCPVSFTFRLCRRRAFELPRISRPSTHPVLEFSVALKLRSRGCASRWSLRVSPRASPSGLALGSSLRVAPVTLTFGSG